MFSLKVGGRNVKNNPKWWQIFIGELAINRSKDKPFCYNYKLSATAMPEVVSRNRLQRKELFGSLLQSWQSTVKKCAGVMENGLDVLETYGAGYIYDLQTLINTARDTLTTFNTTANRYVDVVNGIVTDTGQLLTSTTGLAADTIIDTMTLGDKVIKSAVRYYPTIASEVWNSVLNVNTAFKELCDYCSSIPDEYFSESSWQNIKSLFDDTTSDLDISDVYSSVSHEAEQAANEVQAETAKTVNTMGFAVIAGTEWENDGIAIVYGYKNVVISDAETSWDQLAKDYYGDSSLGTLIATYNNLPGDKPLTSGQSILIPKLDFAESTVSENEVYNSHDNKDNYGKDILLDGKDFGVINGDLDLSTGITNLEQALMNRYSTLVGARIRLEAYGIQASIGDALNATSSLIQASVHQTTIEDPRIDSIEDINFVGIGDELTVTVVYVDINGARRIFGGTV